MHVFGHHYVADQLETVFFSDLIENAHESVAGPRGSKKRQTTIATEGDKVEVPLSVNAFEALRHEEKSHARKPSDGAPAKTYSGVMCRDGIILVEMLLRKSIAKAGATRRTSVFFW